MQNSSSLSIVVHAAASFLSYGSIEIVLSLPTCAFKSPITVFISWHGVHSLARLATTVVIKCILALFLAVVGRCIQLVDGDVDVLSLHSDPAVDQLP